MPHIRHNSSLIIAKRNWPGFHPTPSSNSSTVNHPRSSSIERRSSTPVLPSSTHRQQGTYTSGIAVSTVDFESFDFSQLRSEFDSTTYLKQTHEFLKTSSEVRDLETYSSMPSVFKTTRELEWLTSSTGERSSVLVPVSRTSALSSSALASSVTPSPARVSASAMASTSSLEWEGSGYMETPDWSPVMAFNDSTTEVCDSACVSYALSGAVLVTLIGMLVGVAGILELRHRYRHSDDATLLRSNAHIQQLPDDVDVGDDMVISAPTDTTCIMAPKIKRTNSLPPANEIEMGLTNPANQVRTADRVRPMMNLS